MDQSIRDRCRRADLRMTPQRKVIAAIIEGARDHPDAEAIHARAAEAGTPLSLATIYRTLKLFEARGILERQTFDGARSRYEDARRAHHDHLIDIDTGRVIEFCDPEIEALQEKIARRLGYDLDGHRLELYGRKRRT